MTPRPYQQAAIDAAIAYQSNPKLRGRHGIIVAPTGSGKSIVIAGIATGLDGPCVVFQPSKEILEQNAAKLAAYGYNAAVFSASMGRRERGTITLATIGTAVSHAAAFSEYPYVLIDECHVVNAKGGMYVDFLDMLDKARVIGLTATPFRLATNSFGSELRFITRTRPRIFSDVVHVTQIGDLVKQGYWAPLAYEEVDALRKDRLRLNSTGADYTDKSVQLEFQEVGFVGRLRDEVERQLDEGRRNVLVFTRFVEESERLAKAVPGTAVVTAETPARERAHILEDYKRGKIRCVTNVGVIALGFDYPELECVILGRPTVSLSLYYQMVGRCVRPHQQKACAHVVDMVGLVKQFGRVEQLELRPGGQTGELWTIHGGGRQLTNIYFASRDGGADALKAQRTRRYWAKRMAKR